MAKISKEDQIKYAFMKGAIMTQLSCSINYHYTKLNTRIGEWERNDGWKFKRTWKQSKNNVRYIEYKAEVVPDEDRLYLRNLFKED